MREQTVAEQAAARPRLRRLATSALVVLIVLLPVLLAFARIDAVAGEAEVARVQQAVFAAQLAKSQQALSQPALMFYRSAVPADAIDRWAADKQDITKKARLAGMLALFGVSALVYVLLLLVRGRATAMFGCLTLGLLPPFGAEGFVLRPEQASTLFGVLGVVLITGFPLMLQDRQRGVVPWLTRLALVFVVGIAFGVARSCQVGAWIYLTIPAGALLLAVMMIVLMFPRAVRGKPLIYWPMRAAARRYVPWMLLVLGSFALTFMVLLQGGGRAFDSFSEVDLLPDTLWLSVPLVAFAGLGGLRMGLGVGLRIGRLRRVRPDTVLFLYVAALLMQHFLTRDGIDRMPAAVALACLVGDGVMTAAVLGFGQLAKRGVGSG